MDQPLVLQVEEQRIVLGLRWFPVLDGRTTWASRRLARRYRATHILRAGGSPSVVGLTRVVQSGPLHCAAQLVAQQFPSGTTGLLLNLDMGLTWVVAVHEGLVISRSDRLFANVGEAGRLLEELKQAYPALVMRKELPGDDSAPLAQLVRRAGQHSRLQRLRHFPFSSSWSLWFFPVALAATMLLRIERPGTGQDAVHGRPDTIARPSDNTGSAQADPQATTGGRVSLQSILDAFEALPVRPAGWLLIGARCEQGEGLPARCNARYQRSGMHANNETLFQFLHAHCPANPILSGSPMLRPADRCPWPAFRATFPSLDEAFISWHLAPAAPGPLQAKSADHNDRHLMSALQSIQPAFEELRLESLTEYARPDIESAHAAFPPPPYAARRLHLSGPLRSAALLVDHAGSMAWHSAQLWHSPVSDPDMKRSSLRLILQGVLYESPVPQSESIHALPVGPESAAPQEMSYASSGA